jgi:catechol 2,3-dioxygenase-like lactoylglutathione lyase family enzyme
MFAGVLDAGVPSILGRRMQLGLVVKDLDEAMAVWSKNLGVGPWIVIEGAGEGRRFVHRGEDVELDMSLAFSYAGETQLELIEQRGTTPSLYTTFLDSGREGLHHLGFWPDDFEGSCATLESAGFTEHAAVLMADGTKNVSFYESPASMGVLFEVAPMTDFRRQYMSAIEQLASTWDGTRPVRRFASRDAFIASEDYQNASKA